MPKHCRHCGSVTEDGSLFCPVCGEPVDKELGLRMKLDKLSRGQEHTEKKDETPHHAEKTQNNTYDDDDYEFIPVQQESSSFNWVMGLLIVILVGVVAGLFFLLRG